MKKSKWGSIYSRYIKRLFDIFGSVIILLLFWWVFIICGILIVADTGFPIIYTQYRLGKDGVPFKIYKFRTMLKNADKIGGLSTLQNDTRITGVGKFLRRTSLDELPQIFNVIKGDMSIIGFRPDVPRGEESSTSLSFKLRPGITGYAQVKGRSSLTSEKKKLWEEKYTEDISFFTDLKIIFMTIKAVLKMDDTN